MRFPVETDYSLRIMQTLAKEDRRCMASELAQKVCISQAVALKVLKKLHSADLVASRSGKSGGYELVKKADAISLYDIIIASGEDTNINACVDCNYECSRMKDKEKCILHRLFGTLSQDLSDKLKSVKLSQVI